MKADLETGAPGPVPTRSTPTCHPDMRDGGKARMGMELSTVVRQARDQAATIDLSR
jgi:hypothetical protein